jgi:non-heme chloroperoxidase
MQRLLCVLLLTLGVGLVLVVTGLAAMITFDAPKALPPLVAGETLPGITNWNWAALPPDRVIKARDGAPLTYRLYPGAPDRVVVLIHGSSGASASMHKTAETLQAAGATVYSISLRGHGGSGTVNGDTSYVGQLEDDLADLVTGTGLANRPVHKTLIGFSAGGTFVLGVASGARASLFDDYLSISPYVAEDAPSSRPNAGGWVSIAKRRITALAILDRLGLPWFQDLPVARFATNATPSDQRTPVYSYRLLASLTLGRDWRQRIAAIRRPARVVVGSNDELFHADKLGTLFASLNPAISVTVQPGPGHLGMIAEPAGVAAVATLWRQMTGVEHVERFDNKVREDMFAGMDGDRASFERAMKLIDTTLAAEPDHAQALVWRGDGRLFLAGQAFRRGAIAQGIALSREGEADMARAVALAPNVIAVRVPRATGLLPFARGMRAANGVEADRLTRLAIDDLSFVLAATTPYWGKLDDHDRGELLGALGEAWLQLGDHDRANVWLDRIVAELPGTPYARAAALRRGDPSAKAALTCLSCH